MQCEKFERRLHQVLDQRGRPEDDPQLLFHARACAACRNRLAAQELLWAGLAEQVTPQVSANFAETVVHRALAHRPSPLAVSRYPRRLSTLAAAAALLLALIPTAYWASRHRENADTGTGTATIQPANAAAIANLAPQEPSPPRNDVSSLPAPPQGATVNMEPSLDSARQAREERYAQVLEQWRTQLPELGDRLGLTDADAPTVQGAAAVSQLTNRLRLPLAASIESTLNVLRTALPSASAEQNSTKPQARRWTETDSAAVG
jgi:hypothetical protein